MDANEARKSPALTRRLLRLSAPLAIAGLVTLGTTTTVRATAKAELMALGEGLVEAERTMPPLSGERTLVFNGARMTLLSGTSDRGVKTVLDRFAVYCAPRLLDDYRAQNAPAALLRAEQGSRGFVACLERSGGLGLEEIPGLVNEVAGGDLSALGRPRYFYAERRGATTRYIAVTLESGLDLESIFPQEGDAPGRDVPGVERPAGSTRILSAHQEDEPYQMVVYAGAESDINELAADYRESLQQRGFRLLAPRKPSAEGEEVVFAERQGFLIALIFARDDGEVTTTVLAGL